MRHLGPNWYAVVMGTGIVGSAGAGLPVGLPGLRTVCAAMWALSLVLLAALLAARALHWAYHRDRAREHLRDPGTAPFHGCTAMALVSAGGGTLLVGRDWIGADAALALGAALFGAGTAAGLVAAVAVPYLMVVRHRVEEASPVWLLPLVAPMVSAAVGPLLAVRLPPGQARATLLAGCLALFGMSLLAALLVLPLVFGRLVLGGPPAAALTPALLLVLGPLGQSATAVNAFADAVPRLPYGGVLAAVFGLPVLGFALLWLAWSGALVLRAHRRGMGFAMTWWAFTFPVGTCVTGLEGLARHTGLERRCGGRGGAVRRAGGRVAGGGLGDGAGAGQRSAARSARRSTAGAPARTARTR